VLLSNSQLDNLPCFSLRAEVIFLCNIVRRHDRVDRQSRCIDDQRLFRQKGCCFSIFLYGWCVFPGPSVIHPSRTEGVLFIALIIIIVVTIHSLQLLQSTLITAIIILITAQNNSVHHEQYPSQGTQRQLYHLCYHHRPVIFDIHILISLSLQFHNIHTFL
jgi:hypothetical protein